MIFWRFSQNVKNHIRIHFTGLVLKENSLLMPSVFSKLFQLNVVMIKIKMNEQCSKLNIQSIISFENKERKTESTILSCFLWKNGQFSLSHIVNNTYKLLALYHWNISQRSNLFLEIVVKKNKQEISLEISKLQGNSSYWKFFKKAVVYRKTDGLEVFCYIQLFLLIC